MTKSVGYKLGYLFLTNNGTVVKKLAVNLPIIKFAYLFGNDYVMFASHTKMYYSHDWITFSESTVLDINGSTFVPKTYDNFTNYRTDKNRHIVDGHEIYCWGNYSVASTTQYIGINIWYTADYGVTIKSAYKFRDTRLDVSNPILFARHFHAVNFDPATGKFLFQTGDHTVDDVPESHVIEGVYNYSLDQWTFTLIGSGDNYKWLTAAYIGEYIYFAHDISPGGLKRVKKTEVADYTKFQLVFATPNDCMGFINKGNEGIVLITKFGGTYDTRKFWYTPDLINFNEITGTPPVGYSSNVTVYNGYRGIANGKCTVNCMDYSLLPDVTNWDLLPSLDLIQFIRAQGFPNAFI